MDLQLDGRVQFIIMHLSLSQQCGLTFISLVNCPLAIASLYNAGVRPFNSLQCGSGSVSVTGSQ